MIDEATKTISITWCAQDVIDYAENYCEAGLELWEAWEILKQLYDNHDCNYGLTWAHIEDGIEQYLTEQREE